jgi:hypothetical protein
MCRLYKNPGSLNLLEPDEPIQVCNGIALPLTFTENDQKWNVYRTLHEQNIQSTEWISTDNTQCIEIKYSGTSN